MATKTKNAKEIFVEAIEAYAPSQWAEFLAEACGGDVQLRRRVEILLQAHVGDESLLDRPAIAPVATVDRTTDHTTERIGTLIGPYKLLEQIGEGGMGLVFMAEQQQPVRRLVALKLIKPGMDSQQVIARFEAERQALAMMDHPNIAKFYDAGTVGESGQEPVASGQSAQSSHSLATGSRQLATAPSGRPYFVMELVRGIPINEFCDQQRRSVRQRLELFIQVCQAVQHAHQKGIIHRDLKPTNVLVSMHDAVAVPKVIDFGIAKALDRQLTEHTLLTSFAQMIGTPLYMSPEQAELDQLGVDTTSDVYSLGVLLYELLTGQTPFDKKVLANCGLDEMRRIIREQEPPRPSARVSTLEAAILSTVSDRRCLDPRRISIALRRELDWIVMKALEKDRSDRYESASALARDIERFLHDEPVLACPPTAAYGFRKFARKHKPALVTAAAIAVCLLLGTTVSTWQAVRAKHAEQQTSQERDEARRQRDEAQKQRQRAEANEHLANTQREVAQKQRDEVKAVNEKLQATQAKLRETLYAAHLKLAHENFATGLLEQYVPKTGEPDLRGFE